MQNAPLDEDESEQLMVDNEQAHELLSIANEGTQSRKNLNRAATLFVKVSRLPIKEIRANCLYNAACCYSLLKNKGEALKYLGLSISKFGFADTAEHLDHMAGDSDLDNIRQEPSYKKLLLEFTYKMAEQFYDNEEFAEAAIKYIECARANHFPGRSYYNAACSYSRAKENSKAINCLKMALKKGWKRLDLLKSDDDLKNLREMREFKALLPK